MNIRYIPLLEDDRYCIIFSYNYHNDYIYSKYDSYSNKLSIDNGDPLKEIIINYLKTISITPIIIDSNWNN